MKRADVTPLEAVILFAGAIVAAIGGIAPDAIWTFDVPGVPASVFPLIIAVAIIVSLRLRERPEPLAARDEPAPRWMPVVVWIVAAATLWIFRCHQVYGDGDSITAFLRVGVVFHKREPLSPTLFLLVHRTLGQVLSWEPSRTIAIVNTCAGAFGVLALLRIARVLSPTRAHRNAAACVLLSTAAVELFAGYLENYTVPTVCMLWTCAFAIDAFRAGTGLTRAFALWTTSCLFHLSAIVFLPAMVWLAWQRRRDLSVVRLAAVTVVPAAALFATMTYIGFMREEEPGFGGGDGHMLVPLFERSGMSQYLFLRPAHLLAIANEQLLVAPLGLVLLLTGVIAFVARRMKDDNNGAHLFLLLVASGFFALTVIWNPDFGPLRDWDLFGPVGFYLNVAGVAIVMRELQDSPRSSLALCVFIAAVNASRALPFILHNAVP